MTKQITLLVTLLLAVGCSDARYTGLSPSSRTFTTADAGTKDYYVGLNANFSVGQPGGPQAAAAATQAARDVSPTQPIGVAPHLGK